MYYFDWKIYLKNYPHLKKEGINDKDGALEHWRNIGKKKGYTYVDKNFDWQEYIKKKPYLKKQNINSKERAWKHMMKYNNDQSKHIKNRKSNKKSVLVITDMIPTPDMDSGSNGIFNLILILNKSGYKTTLLAYKNFDIGLYKKYVRLLTDNNIGFIHKPNPNQFKEWIKMNGYKFGIIQFTKFESMNEYYGIVDNNTDNAKIIFNTLDLYYIRLKKKWELTKKKEDYGEFMTTKRKELDFIRTADITLVINDVEKEEIGRQIGKHILKKIVVIPLIIPSPSISVNPFAVRSNICFIGGFYHQPNVDAVKYFINKIFPHLKHKIPGLQFKIIGPNFPEKLKKEYSFDGIQFLGHVKNLDPVFNNIKLSVSPLRWGAGSKGKIGTSLSYGVPCVATSLSISGMRLEDGKNIIIADTISDYVDKICLFYNNKIKWDKISKESLKAFDRNFSIGNATRIVKKDLVKLL